MFTRCEAKVESDPLKIMVQLLLPSYSTFPVPCLDLRGSMKPVGNDLYRLVATR